MEVCFHCGERIGPGKREWASVGGCRRPVCCPGCGAVATLIDKAGLGRFYRFRERPSPKPVAASRQQRRERWRVFDRPAVAARLTSAEDGGLRGLRCLVEGLTCGACVWLIERALEGVPGIVDVTVNPVSREAWVRFDPAAVACSDVLASIADLGFEPRPRAPATASADAAMSRAQLKRLAVAGFGFAQVMTFSAALYLGLFQNMDATFRRFFVFVSMLVATPVVLYAGAPIFSGVWRDLRRRTLGMDVPVGLALAAALVVSVVNAFRASGHVYFDSATMFVFFLTLGRFLERRARRQALTRFDALAEMLPPCALRRRGDRLERVGTVEIEPGDVLVVEPGAIVPADGSLLSERASIDESLLSGEAMPRSRGRGEPVIGGTLNVGRNPIEIGASTRSCAGYLDRVRGLLDRAIADRPRFVRLADRYARWFVAAVLSVTAATGLAWWLTVPARAFDVVLSMLVVTCPCALSLATPTALAVALSGLARHGVLLTSARVLERLSAVRCWLFDKTGTLTSGDIVLTGAETVADLDEEQCMAIAAALEAGVDHPIAAAFDGRAAGSRAQDVEYVAGAGVSGVVDGKRYRLGSPGYALDAERAPLSGEIWLAGDDRVLCRFGLSDRLRPTAGAAVAALAGAGHQVALVSGDCAAAVSKTARDLGIADFFFEQKPEDKLALIRQRQQQGFAVAAVGDGINDAPFLAGADVSVAMMEGSRLAQASASIVFTGEDLTTLAKLPEWARRTRRVIAQNLAWAVAYNAVALPAAAAGWVSPWMAALGMSLSSVVVVTNALRLRGQLARGERAGARAPRLMQPLQRPSP